MSFELFLARRYLTARRKQAFISMITSVSILGVTIGVMALVIALSLITGFQEDVQAKILGATSHLMISDLSGEGLKNYRELAAEIGRIPEIEAVTPVIYNTVLILGPARNAGALLKGLDFQEETRVAGWLQRLQAGQLPAPGSQEEILLGKDLAASLGVSVGDPVNVLIPSGRLTPVGLLPRTRTFRVSGLFDSGLYEFDSSTALISLDLAQKLFNLPARVSYLQVRIKDIFQAEKVAEKIYRLTSPGIYITTWMELNRSLFSALKLEKTLLFLTITLIVVVAALNIIASLVLMVMEKTRDIGVLMAMGATARNIRKIFFLQGAIIGVVGTSLGLVLGLAWCWLANTFKLIKVPVDIYQISYVPFHAKPLDLALIVLVTLAITFISTVFPSRRAARIDPVQALKYE
ncbi:MAG: lipoprotein-releasing ABC transporter permease subunit [Candidatus Saccharicenans sp.]|jgi:lipoprotein-releasing system permease protein|nr:lipoprotein-releasing ABC transporter permease subunit [Candidatus Saccharicenans sp.]MDH7493439.1 lipoprotein-releasing ABC transporter permease subunit [Candidatus Saccharicenans sp.]